MNIDFFKEETDFELNQQKNARTWISRIISDEGYELKQLNYIFCSDDYLYSMNQKYLNHDFFTDIVTFDNSETENTIESDIFISVDRVKENALLQQTTFEDELARVLIHGVLHLMGWGDKTESLKKQMRIKEDACLSLR
ncbi:MAG: rRNA maturation RNase YbeY [Cyclobacteriaceae bacterium]|nr:rRNA maturation RNase YbeY [Cyclobacteriaceae bacterium]